VPFFALLSEKVRTSSEWLLGLAALTLALRVLEAAVFVLPPLGIQPLALLLDIPAALCAIGASLLMGWVSRCRCGSAGQAERRRPTHSSAPIRPPSASMVVKPVAASTRDTATL